MRADRIAGVLPVINTPFDDDDRIDQAALKHEIDWVFEQGAQGICAGMVSELLRLTYDERDILARSMVELAAGRGVVITSVGAESTEQARAFARQAIEAGCDAMMAVPPISTALSGSEVSRYFQALAEEVDLPLIVQDASAYVGQPIDVGVLADLLERYGPTKILFKPEASPLGPNLSALRDRTNGEARIFDGSGGISLVDSFRRGIAGTMPGVDMLDATIALWRALQAGDEDEIYRLYFPICAMVALQMQAGLDGFIAIEKHILVKRGLFPNARRREPNGWTLDNETAAEVDRLLSIMGVA
jgi:2-keto-3-deoxy-L-arabinonate dehydratase